jgi:hypothetical protein
VASGPSATAGPSTEPAPASSTAPSDQPSSAPSADQAPVPPSAPEPTPPQEAPAQPSDSALDLPGGVIGTVISAAVQQVSRVIRPEAATAVAVGFGFPLILTIAVSGFLAIQNRLDGRDPKLRLAPRSHIETVVKFREEAEL